MRAGRLTCHSLVQQYLRRIEAYDKRGPAINAIVVINPGALAEADELDRRFKATGPVGPLHCVPAIVKDNFETIGLQSADGSLALEGFVSNRDAFLVGKIKAAGAIVLAKSNMAEFAFTPYETVSSILPGYTKNPYALDRVTAGSSGGTAAAIAANFGLIGLGSDTGNSIRGPSSHQALVGIRSTMGLTSRSGVAPLNLLADIAGPMTRTVEDAVAVFGVIAGPDPADPVTVADSPIARDFSPGGRPTGTPPDYSRALNKDGLKGARIGVLRQAYERDTTDAEIVKVFTAALEDMKRAGARSWTQCASTSIKSAGTQGAGTCGGFKYDINRYLAAQGDRVPVHSLEEIIKSRRFHPSVQPRLQQAQDGSENGPDTAACKAESAYREQVRAAVLKTMEAREAGCLRLSDLEQPAAAHRRSQHSARRQQPVLLADDRVSRHHRSDGLHARNTPGWHDLLRPRVGRGDADRPCVRLRAGHASPACAPDEIGRSVLGVRRSKAARSGSRAFRKSRALIRRA